MICETSCSTLLPRQPFMVKCGEVYYKKVMNELGISHFYCYRQAEGSNQIETSVPDGCTDLIFTYDAAHCNVGVDLYGSPLNPHSFEMVPGNNYFGVRFLPGNMLPATGLSAAEVIDQVLPLDDIPQYAELVERIAAEHTFDAQVNLFMKFYMEQNRKCLTPTRNSVLKKYLIRHILMHSGNLRVNELAADTGYSVRYINGVFKSEMGISPKAFCRIIRFQKCLSDLCSGYSAKQIEDISAEAMNLGYADESHMIRDFKNFSRRTPRGFLRELEQFQYSSRLKIM